MFGSEKWINSAQIPSFTINPDMRPALIWRRGNFYNAVDSKEIPPDFIKLGNIEARITRAGGKTQRMTLRVFAARQSGNTDLPHDRPESAQRLRNGTPVAVRKGSITHRGRRFRIRAPQKITDCAYTRLLDRLIDGDPLIDALLGDSRPTYKITASEAPEPEENHGQTYEGSILCFPSGVKITSKGRNVTRDELSKEFAYAPSL